MATIIVFILLTINTLLRKLSSNKKAAVIKTAALGTFMYLL